MRQKQKQEKVREVGKEQERIGGGGKTRDEMEG
jgi:hypothetical protein